MWWGPWPAHVDGWWRRARDGDNVLFVHFEEMKRDLPRVAGLVSNFLGLGPIGDRELERVLYKCSFGQMRKHAEVFEVYPPHILATAARLFVQGDVDRYADVPAAAGQRIRAWCVAELKNASYPFAQIYHDAATTDVLRDEPQR
jgi:hypothetical protein